MNPETKEFEPVTEQTPSGWKTFVIGHKFTLNGVRFYIRKITRKDIVCRPVK